jgi:hypothetical protein
MASFVRKFRVQNRVDELIKVIEEVTSEDNIDSRLEEAARESARIFFPVLKASAPVGEDDELGRGRPSVRQHGTTLDDAWELPEIVRTPKGVWMRFKNNAPHMRILTDGAIGHTIPGSNLPYPLRFWWKGQTRHFWEVHHPGFRKFNFVRNAWRRLEGKASAQERFKKSVKGMFGPLHNFFGTDG